MLMITNSPDEIAVNYFAACVARRFSGTISRFNKTSVWVDVARCVSIVNSAFVSFHTFSSGTLLTELQ